MKAMVTSFGVGPGWAAASTATSMPAHTASANSANGTHAPTTSADAIPTPRALEASG
jgi:hypothetical protein